MARRIAGATVTLGELFDGRRSQLLVHHLGFELDRDEGRPSCSFWADGFDGIGVPPERRAGMAATRLGTWTSKSSSQRRLR